MGKEKIFWKGYFFNEFFINFLAAFLGPRLGAPPWHHLFTIATAVMNNLEKDNMPIYQRLSETFLLLRNMFPKNSIA
jgi:hypothetical protein